MVFLPRDVGMWLFGEGELIGEAIFFHVGNAYLEREPKNHWFLFPFRSQFSMFNG